MIIEKSLIISFATWLGNKIADKGFDDIYEKLNEKDEIDEKFVESIRTVSNKLEKKYPDILGNSISYFFTKEEVFNELCKLLFVNQNVNPEVIIQSFDDSTLPNGFIIEFITELKNELSKQPKFIEFIGNKELFIAVKGISKNVEDISINSTLTNNEIKEIKKILEKQFREKFNLESFKSLYLKNLLNNVGEINFIGLGIDPSIKKGKRKELDAIFVKPFFKLTSKLYLENEANLDINNEVEFRWDNEKKRIPFKDIFDREYNYVILGNPGSGKSLLIKSLILYISNRSKQFKSEEILSYIPFRIELKNYLTFKKTKGGNILKYLTRILEDEYSIHGVLEDNLSNVLLKEKSILFFDGLDEIFNVADKINVKNDIENFHNLFPNIRSIVTSRYDGYNEAKLDESKFCELNILSFNQDQVKEYVSKWYLLEEENSETRNFEISDFISKMNNIDSELLSNPLLLSLIVILYRNNLKIPDSKLEIYQSCTNTLVDKWDASKNLDLQIDEKILQKKEPILSDLAYWQYETLSSSNTEVTYHKAKKVVSDSLVKKKIADDDNNGHLAEVFLNYAQKRSIYFDNNFTHKTFLEYYTAFWIYTNIELKHNIVERNKIIKKYISNPFWSIVIELLLNMIDKDQPDSDILDNIIKENLKSNKSFPFLVFIIPNLKNISKKVQELVYHNSVKYLINSATKIKKNSQNLKDLYQRIQRSTKKSEQEDLLISAINSIKCEHWNKYFFILINELDFSPKFKNDIFLDIKKSDFYCRELENDPYLFQLDISVYGYNDNIILDYMDITIKYLKLFGVEEIFKEHSSYYDRFFFAGFIHFFFHHQLKKENISSMLGNLRILKKYNIETIHLLKYLVEDGHISEFDNESFKFLFDQVEISANGVEKVFLILLIKIGFDKRKYPREFEWEAEFRTFTNSAETIEIMQKLVKISNSNEVLKEVLNSYNFVDTEIFQITNALNISSSSALN